MSKSSIKCQAKISVSQKIQAEIINDAEAVMIDSGFEPNISKDILVSSISVYPFFTDTKIMNHTTITHAALEVDTISDLYGPASYVFEWGKWTGKVGKHSPGRTRTKKMEDSEPIVIVYNPTTNSYEHHTATWHGIKVKLPVKEKISMYDVFVAAQAWKTFYGNPGQYPQNCRGWIDFALRNLFCFQMNWKTFIFEPILKCKPNLFNHSKLVEIK